MHQLQYFQKYQTCSVADLARAWNTLVFSRSRKRSKSQEWIPKVLTDEPNGRIWLSATHPNIIVKERTNLWQPSAHAHVCSICVFTKVTWKKLDKNLLQELNQQASALLFIFSQLKSLYNVFHLCIHLEENKGQYYGISVHKTPWLQG